MDRPSHPLEKDVVEEAALKEDWGRIRQHLLSIDEEHLPQKDKSYALYWMGVALFKTGQHQAAAYNWNKAQKFKADPALQGMIERALQSLKSYGYSDVAPTLSNDRSSRGTWVIQLGIFRLRKSAEDLAKNLAWKGLDLQIDEIRYEGALHWVVWCGPFTGSELPPRQADLERKRLAYVVKTLDFIRP